MNAASLLLLHTLSKALRAEARTWGFNGLHTSRIPGETTAVLYDGTVNSRLDCDGCIFHHVQHIVDHNTARVAVQNVDAVQNVEG